MYGLEGVWPPQTPGNWRLVGDHAHEVACSVEVTDHLRCSLEQVDFIWSVDVPRFALVDDAVSVQERNGHAVLHTFPWRAGPLDVGPLHGRGLSNQLMAFVALNRLIPPSLLGKSVLIEKETATLLGAIGMLMLAASWWWKAREMVRLAQIGWVLVGFYFFTQAWTYMEHNDPILTIMAALTLPLSCWAAWWEGQAEGRKKEAIVWARGTVAFAGGPYLLIAYVPYLSVLAIWFVASQSAMFLGFATGTDIQIGTTWVNDTSGRVAWEDWDGNRWFATDFTGEYAFQSELLLANGEAIGINFVLACTAIQSMVLFIGAIAVLDLSWKKRVRALLLILPTIHLLNLFRNAGLIWMHMTYTEWTFWGLSVFEFGHSYVARFVSLFAMFLLALIMFEMLPSMHRNILSLTGTEPKKRR